MIIPPEFNGPPNSAHGGYVCGRLAEQIGGRAEVTLLRPIPLGQDLEVRTTPNGVELADGAAAIARAEETEIDVDVAAAVSAEEAEEASRRFAGFRAHAYPTCYVCGTERSDGLDIFPGALPDSEMVASTWIPGAAEEVFIWAVLDCTSGWAITDFSSPNILLGRMAAETYGLPTVGTPHVSMGWPIEVIGRRRMAASALYTETGELLGVARATWVELKQERANA